MSTHSAECSPHTCFTIETVRRAPSTDAACGRTLIRKTSLLRKINPMMRRSSFTNKEHLKPDHLAMNERRNVPEIVNGTGELLRGSQTRIDLLFTMSEITQAYPLKDNACETMFRGRHFGDSTSTATCLRQSNHLVEPDGIEPTTSCLQSTRSPS